MSKVWLCREEIWEENNMGSVIRYHKGDGPGDTCLQHTLKCTNILIFITKPEPKKFEKGCCYGKEKYGTKWVSSTKPISISSKKAEFLYGNIPMYGKCLEFDVMECK